jgi:hypothetical protein
MAKKSTRVVIPLKRPGGLEPSPGSDNVLMCGGCSNELPVAHNLSGTEIQNIYDTHRTNCKLPIIRL